MISMIGRGLVMSSLFFATIGCVAGFVAGYRRNTQAWIWARNSAYGFSLSMILANLLMVYALVTHDFSVSYVAEVGSLATPPYFTVVSLWASLNGSILFWGAILGIYTAGMVWSIGDRHREYMPWAIHVQMGIALFFAFLVASIANPFEPVFPVPPDGPGPNPLLQNHWLMAVHPPMLYLGYVGMSVPYSLICASLLAGRLEAGWMVPVRRWMLIPWAFLSVGIVLGGWWSYAVLGWGGAWAWDPVENASFHPWLTGTAFLHSAMVLQRRNRMRDWTLVLGMATFLLTLLGTFMTRSGVFNSVHSFTQSDIGPVFLVFIGVVLVYSVVLLSLRSHTLDEASKATDAKLGAKAARGGGVWSRETAILVQNALFSVFTFMVLLGTLYPLMAEALQDRRVSVGEPYFDRWALPLGLGLVFMMGVGPAWPWGRLEPGAAMKRLAPAVGVGVVLAGVFAAFGFSKPFTVLALFTVGFAFWANLYEFLEPVMRRMRARSENPIQAIPKVWGKARRRFGGHIAHYGVLMTVFSLALAKGYRIERDFTMVRGETVQFEEYDITFEGARLDKQVHRDSLVATYTVPGLRKFEPRMNYYPSQREPIFSPEVYETPLGDLYFSIIEVAPTGETSVIRLIYQPFQMWMWWGAPMVFLGTMISIWPQRKKGKPSGTPQAAEGA